MSLRSCFLAIAEDEVAEKMVARDSAPDPYLHFNIRIFLEPRTYHVRCHEHALGDVVVFLVAFKQD